MVIFPPHTTCSSLALYRSSHAPNPPAPTPSPAHHNRATIVSPTRRTLRTLRLSPPDRLPALSPVARVTGRSNCRASPTSAIPNSESSPQGVDGHREKSDHGPCAKNLGGCGPRDSQEMYSEQRHTPCNTNV